MDDGGGWPAEASRDWEAATGGVVHPGRIGRAMRPLLERVMKKNQCALDVAWGMLRPWWREYLSLEDPRYRTPERFASSPDIVLRLRKAKEDEMGSYISNLRGGE